MSERATKNGVLIVELPKLRPVSLVGVFGSMVMGAVLALAGARVLLEGSFPTLFGITLLALGSLGIVLGLLARMGKRPAWAVLVAMWCVMGFCAFFATPKIVKLPKLESATVEMELKLGRKK